MPLPTWNAHECAKVLQLSADGLMVRYRGSAGKERDRLKHAGSVKATMSFGIHGIFYFEVTVLNAGDTGEISVGLMTEKSNLTDIPGWGEHQEDSGYHGDAGAIVYEGKEDCQKDKAKYSTGDTVGVGVWWHGEIGTIIYTKNGKYLGSPLGPIAEQDVWPAVGIVSTGGEVRGNFGAQPFIFDLAKYTQDPEAFHKHAEKGDDGEKLIFKHHDELWNKISQGAAKGAGKAIGKALVTGLFGGS